MVEDDFRLLKDRLVIPIPPVNHRTEKMQRVHVFLCVIELLLLRYLMHKCDGFGLSRDRLMEELDGIRIAVVQDKASNEYRLVYEQMTLLQGRLMAYLDMGKHIEK